MSEVVLVVPPNELPYTDEEFVADRLGVGYLAATLREQGITVTVLHCPVMQLDAEAAAERIVQEHPSLVGLSALFSEVDLIGMFQVAQAVRERLPDVHITVGGHPPSLTANQVLACFPAINSVVRGEGEETLLELAYRLRHDLAWQTVRGLAYCQNGQVTHNPARPLIDNLDRLPFPARDVLDSVPSNQAITAMISSSRGCFGHCTFCSIQAFYGQSPGYAWRARGPENVVDEIEHLRKRWPVRSIQFVDDNFVGTGRRGRQRALGIAEAIIRRKLRICFTIESRADCVDKNLFEVLKRAGLSTVFLGIESNVQRALDFFDKGTSIEVNRRAVEIVRNLGLKCLAGFIPFDPYTTPAELCQNLDFLEETGLDQELDTFPRFLNRLQVYPGCPIQRILDSDGLLIPIHDRRLNGYIAGYSFRFVDRRTEALFHAMSAAGYSEGGRFLVSTDFLHLRDRWRLWIRRVASLCGLPSKTLEQLPALHGPFMTLILEPWLEARWREAMRTFRQMVKALDDGGDGQTVPSELPEMLRAEMSRNLQEVDTRYVGTLLQAKLKELEAFLAQERVSFQYGGNEYHVDVKRRT